ncbi:MAG: CRTAC1 family protein, partial [Gemmatimonadetes bacterium]|nr:CRTAC1 family protein [Gemmatimonadota bacterium]
FEDTKDVKCWTSFKQLEKFVAGCQLAPETTHLKTEVVVNYVDQIWARAAAGKSGPLSAAAFDAAAQEFFPGESTLFDVTVHLDEPVVIPAQDVENYLGTVEPVRVVQSAAARVRAADPERAWLGAEAVDASVRTAALLSTLVLNLAADVARAADHEFVEDEHMLEVDRRVAEQRGLTPYDPESAIALPFAGDTDEDPLAALLGTIDHKVESLRRFNTKWVHEKMNDEFVEELGGHEAEWAGRPVDPAFSAAYKEDHLVERAAHIYEACARDNPGADVLSGRAVLRTVLEEYPFVTTYQGGNLILPDQKVLPDLWVQEYEADAFRDSGWHWKAVREYVSRISAEGADLPTMDLYGLEELTEFLSVYGVAFVKAAGRVAGTEGRSTVEAAVMPRVVDAFARAQRLQAQAGTEAASAKKGTKDQSEALAVRAQLDAAYIGDFFTDVTDNTGIVFRHTSSPGVHRYRFLEERGDLPDAIPRVDLGIAGGGVAVEDYDGDGLPDIYLVNGGRDRLFRNLGGFRFEDVTDRAGLDDDDEGRGAYFVDYDNDGDQDLFVTQVYAPNRLLRNTGDGKFEDVTRAAGFPIRTDLLSHSATWLDYDNDGHLDVYIGNFGDWLADDLPLVQANSRNAQANQLFRNRGDGTFEDVTDRTGATGDRGWTHAVSHFDADGDGWQDLYLANDFGADVILLNRGGKTFEDGTPDDLEKHFLHGMSVGFTDVNADGIEDVYVSNIAMFQFVTKYVRPDSTTTLQMSRRTVQNTRMAEHNVFLVSGDGSFADQHHSFFNRSRQGAGWAWDADFFDFDNDGEEDLYIVNGREANLSYDRERNVLYKQHDGHFYDVSEGSGADFRANSRGTVHTDLDGDGDLDLVVNNFEGPAVILRNNLQRNGWIRFDPVGTESNRDAVGARIRLVTESGEQVRTIRGGSGFLSKEPTEAHFGIARGDKIRSVEIRWPSGRTQDLGAPEMNRVHRVTEPGV